MGIRSSMSTDHKTANAEHGTTIDGVHRETVADLLSKFALTSDETGRFLGVTAATVANLHRCGALRAVKIGARWCWRPCDVQRFVEALEPGK